jgi:hypothetical protein
MNNGHGICSKCGDVYITLEEAQRQASMGYRCRCYHCPCRGLCSVGCKCEPRADSRRACVDWEKRR